MVPIRAGPRTSHPRTRHLKPEFLMLEFSENREGRGWFGWNRSQECAVVDLVELALDWTAEACQVPRHGLHFVPAHPLHILGLELNPPTSAPRPWRAGWRDRVPGLRYGSDRPAPGPGGGPVPPSVRPGHS